MHSLGLVVVSKKTHNVGQSSIIPELVQESTERAGVPCVARSLLMQRVTPEFMHGEATIWPQCPVNLWSTWL